jgi:hypothetical protein
MSEWNDAIEAASKWLMLEASLRSDACGDAIELVLAPGVLALKRPEPPARCPICDWPLADNADAGCVPGNCSYRPHEGSPEYHRIRLRKAFLDAARSPVSGIVDADVVEATKHAYPVDAYKPENPLQVVGHDFRS